MENQQQPPAAPARAASPSKSEAIDGLAAALAKAQGAIKPAIKDAKNPHFGNTYADLASVWDACREPLSSNGLSIVQLPAMENSTVSVTTVLMHTSGQWISSRISTLIARPDPQGVGSAITYLRRYALAAMVGIAPEDDDAEAATAHEQQRQRSEPRQQQRGNQRPPQGRPEQQRQQGGAQQAAEGDKPPSLEHGLRQIAAAKSDEEVDAVGNTLRPLKWTPEERKTIGGAIAERKKTIAAAARAAAQGPCEHCGKKNGRHDQGCPGVDPKTAPREPGSDG